MTTDRIMLDAIYGSSEAVDAVITLADTDGTELEVRALYVGSGLLAGGGDMVGVSTVRNSAAIRLSQLDDAGYEPADLHNATIAFSSENWAIKSWVPRPGRTGAASGELLLILTEPRS